MRVERVTIDSNEPKCGGCNFQTSEFFHFEGTEGEFDTSDGYGPGLCAACFLEMVVESKMDVTNGTEYLPEL